MNFFNAPYFMSWLTASTAVLFVDGFDYATAVSVGIIALGVTSLIVDVMLPAIKAIVRNANGVPKPEAKDIRTDPAHTIALLKLSTTNKAAHY